MPADHLLPALMPALDDILSLRATTQSERSLLVGISGIDASGKGYVGQRLRTQLEARGLRVALINVDGWLNLPQRRFNSANPAGHFYLHALRLDDMFKQLVLPLKQQRGFDLIADFAEETATTYRAHRYQFTDIDVVLVEGIFLFKPAYRAHFDLRIWIACSFEAALRRAIARGQEGLSRAATIAAYQRIYFPAQRIHFARDYPQLAADIVIDNDARASVAARDLARQHAAQAVVTS